ncbi:MAG TPA: hypothetical protein VGV37_07465 [Aliidongia sp.]|uniref:hypothetical protein n=1 Tax=Aliidongia sp. TaxID=1914230 RepID=UPI002DDD3568|nr:hypothetical protein [Aliidongia sp.]HEV2674364.1 hypothetical protein [Aliidongia sp.]
MSIYLRKNLVFIPTTIETNGASCMDIEPVSVIPVTDQGELRRAIENFPIRGNLFMEHIPRMTGILLPTIAASARVKSWSAFYRGVSAWSLYDIDGIYRLLRWRSGSGRGLNPDEDGKILFTRAMGFDAICNSVVETVQAEAAKKS